MTRLDDRSDSCGKSGALFLEEGRAGSALTCGGDSVGGVCIARSGTGVAG